MASGRYLRCAVACLYLAGYLLTFFHFAGERHAVCHEHGDQHHVAESDEHASTAVVELPRLHAGADIEDDHCALFEFLRTSSFTIGERHSSLPAVSPVDAGDARLDTTSFVPADRCRWRLAPKNSPPAVA